MAQFSQGNPPPPPPMMGLHTGRIPCYKNNNGENFQTRCAAEPPACVQNAMLTKDKKPFTYTPGGLDLSQIRTPSMARRLNKQQQQQEDQSNPAYFRQPSINGAQGGNGGGLVGMAPAGLPPPPPPPPPGPPPPPALVINVAKPPKAVPEGERPEIVIPENPIGMLRKTNSPYHWESELSDRLQQGPIPKFVEKSATPSPVAPQMKKPQQVYQPPPPQQFSQIPPQYSQQVSPQNQQSTSPQQKSIQQQNKSPSTSPIWKPEPKYPPVSLQSNHSSSPVNCISPTQNQAETKIMLQRQDSQFNHSPSPYSMSSSTTTSSSNNTNQSMSPYCETQTSTKSSTPISSNSASPWKPETRNFSPCNQNVSNSPQLEARSPNQQLRNPMMTSSPAVRTESPNVQNSRPANNQNTVNPNAPWRQQQNNGQLKLQIVNGESQNNNNNPQQNNLPARPGFIKSPSPPKQNQQPQYMNTPMSPDNETRFQTHMTIPVTPRKVKTDSIDSPKENLPWVRNENAINKAVAPPPWCQRTTEGRKTTDSYDNNESAIQPPWVQRSNDGRMSLPRDTVKTPPTSEPQPPWVTDNRRYETLPRAQPNKSVMSSNTQNNNVQGRIIPIQMDVSTHEINRNNTAGHPPGKQQPKLRIIIGMNQQGQPTAQMQGPQQHISRVLSPQLMRMDAASLSSPIRMESPAQPAQNQPRTRIIPIQMEPPSPGITSPRIRFHQVGPARQSRAFRVLQKITGTQDDDDMNNIENHCGYTDL